MATMIVYPVPAGSLPDAAITWKDAADTVIDLTGYAITAMVGKPGKTQVIAKTTGFATAAVAPNLTIAWALDELAALSVSEDWVIQLAATRTSDGKKRYAQIPLTIAAKMVTA